MPPTATGEEVLGRAVLRHLPPGPAVPRPEEVLLHGMLHELHRCPERGKSPESRLFLLNPWLGSASLGEALNPGPKEPQHPASSGRSRSTMKASRLVLLFLVGLLAILVELPSAAGQTDVCRLPKVVGPCDAVFPRWFYNWETQKCEEFNYGGCGGNKNNFKTLEECAHACGHHGSRSEAIVGECPKPPGAGLCVENCGSDDICGPGEKCCSNGCGHQCTKVTGVLDTIQIWFLVCLQSHFLSSFQRVPRERLANVPSPRVLGSVPNCVQVMSLVAQERSAAATDVATYAPRSLEAWEIQFPIGMGEKEEEEEGQGPSSSPSLLTFPPVRDMCSPFPKESEECGEPKRRFFYNISSKACESFLSRGCLGNMNRFHTVEECQRHCAKIDRWCHPPGPLRGLLVAQVASIILLWLAVGKLSRLADHSAHIVPWTLNGHKEQRVHQFLAHVDTLFSPCGIFRAPGNSPGIWASITNSPSTPVGLSCVAEKAGFCPPSPTGFTTECLTSCIHDGGCPDDQKCCSYGCALRCTDPVK
ncbi:hypothetical protein JD844_019404, partial [Phrynosoma platyrhinos]